MNTSLDNGTRQQLFQDLCDGRGAGSRSACHDHPGAEEEGGEGVDSGGGGCPQKTNHREVPSIVIFSSCLFLATLVALHFTPVSESVSERFIVSDSEA